MSTQPDWALLPSFYKLETFGKIQAEYIWIGGSSEDVRSKTMTLDDKPYTTVDLPIWNYDGSSTNQASGKNSEVYIKPRAIFRDPFRGAPNILVMCDTYDSDDNPLPTNSRHEAAQVMERAKDQHPWFGLEQEYTLFTPAKWPLGWPHLGYPPPQGPYYCSAGASVNYGRPIVEAHYRACLYAGVKIAGINAEVMPGQWEFQVGPCEGIDVGDHLWVARYIMHRLSEYFNLVVSFDPKPISGDWNGAGCHTNFSTQAMREAGGYEHIIKGIEKLRDKHDIHIKVYGAGNERRLTGAHETARIDQFSYGVAHRGASVRIPRSTFRTQQGYFEDRRPASNCDPYVVTSRIVKTVCLDD
jgi:glutamine synthetase